MFACIDAGAPIFVTAAKARDRRVVGEQVRADDPERHIDMAGTLDLPGRHRPGAARVEEERDHRRWMVCSKSPAVAAVVRVEGRQVHLVDSIEGRRT
jgi:hypothetical protein